MADPEQPERGPWHGPADGDRWPSQLAARVVAPGARPCVHGYDVQEDLALHYSFGETVLLALTGQPPSKPVGEAFEVTLTFLAPVSSGEAPAHAAGLAHMVGAETASVLACAGMVLAERARHLLREHAELLAWLEDEGAAVPESALATIESERQAAQRLQAALAPSGLQVSLLSRGPTLLAACLAVLHRCGLRQPWQLEAALCAAAWPLVAAEAFAVPPLSAGDHYPLNLPRFEYTEEPRRG